MAQVPREDALDSTLTFLANPYRFISDGCRRHGSDVFEARLLGQRTFLMTGPDATEVFYDTRLFERKGAMPGAVRKTLLGQGGVQGLDDEAHRARKQMHMSLMTPDKIGGLVEAVGREWEAAAPRWEAGQGPVVLYPAVQRLLTRAVCAWAGVPLPEDEVEHRTRQLMLLYDAAAAKNLRHVLSRLARKRADGWAADVVGRVRAGTLRPADGTAAHTIAWHRDPDGQLLDPHHAAVALLNVLRPTVAVSVFLTLIAHALHQHPQAREALGDGSDDADRRFVQEVRRYYPFFPATAARVRHDFEWAGYRFPEGRRVVLDLYGTDHDARTWDDPEAFQPDRFLGWDGSPYNFVPQGGGDHFENHRCAGEWITIALMEQAVDVLARRLRYDVPMQDLQIEMTRMPALPRSRFVMDHVRPVA